MEIKTLPWYKKVWLNIDNGLYIKYYHFRIPASACHGIRHESRRKKRARFTETKSVAAPS